MKTNNNNKDYEVVATAFDGRRAGSCRNTRLAICLYWAKEQKMAVGDSLRFEFYHDSQLITQPINVR